MGCFDQVTRTAQKLFNVPVALINLLDDESRRLKVEARPEPVRKSCEDFFCQGFISSDTPLIISDAANDPRLQGHPLVTRYPHICFYAEIPLHCQNDEVIGSLCLIDFRPRNFDESEVAALADIAAWAELKLDTLKIKQEKEIIRENEARLQALIESAGDAILTVEEKGRIKTFNPAASKIFGHESEKIIGHHIARLVVKRERSQLEAYVQELIQGRMNSENHLRRELTGVHASGSAFEAEIIVAQIQIKERREFIVIVRDISEEKKIERMKNDFVSTVSHELRTPLTSIRGSLGLLLGSAAGVIPPGAKKLLDIANNNCERLIRLINDLLDVQKIESGHMHFNMGIYPLLQLVHQAIDATQSFAMQFQVNFNLELPESDELICVSVDPDRLVRVIVNLLSNAAKFSPPGSKVDIKVKQQEKIVRLSVIDKGPGIPDEFRSRIFNKFCQFNTSDSQKKAGTGLGLSISKTIIERLGGQVGFHSKPGEGSEFFFELPVMVSSRSISFPSKRVLVYEPDPTMANLFAHMLAKGGLGCDVAFTAEQARAMVMAQDYRALALDFELPGEDGLAFLNWLRSQEKLQNLPVVMVSAQERHKSEGNEITPLLEWIVKPINEKKFLAAVDNVVQKKRAGKPCVLYVEDDLDLANVITALLAPAWEVVHAVNLSHAQRNLELRKFDVVLLDLQFPDGNGSELICSLPALNASIPVIVFSGQEGSQHVAKTVQRVLVKSRTSNEQLVETLNSFIFIDQEKVHIAQEDSL